ncbi:MAG: hypothetical protein AB4038_17620 [Prochloraceae cyanobacterium]
MSNDQSWSEIETDLNRNSIRVYQLEVKQVRLDVTTNSGYHLVTEEGLFQQVDSISWGNPSMARLQFGHSKDNPNLPQIKTMMATLDMNGDAVSNQGGVRRESG